MLPKGGVETRRGGHRLLDREAVNVCYLSLVLGEEEGTVAGPHFGQLPLLTLDH